MNNAQARLVNQVLTTAVQGIGSNEYVGKAIFPAVTVTQRGGTTIIFNDNTDIADDLIRAPGSTRKTFSPSYDGVPYAIEQRSVSAKVAVETEEEAQNGPGISLSTIGIAQAKDQLDKKLEIAQSKLARDAGKYASTHKATLTGTDKWSDPASQPLVQIEDAAQSIRNKTGKRPNTLLLSANAFATLKFHPVIVERLKFGNIAVLTPAFLGALIDIPNVVIGNALTNGSDIWGNDAVLAYVAVGSLTNAEPSYGYTYTLQGTPNVLNGYFDNSCDSWMYPVNVEATPVLAWEGAGFLFKNVK